MKQFAKTVTTINRYLYNAAKWIIFLIVPIMLFEVVSRYVFNSSTIWASELATLLFGPYFLLGGPYLLHTGGHVAVDLLKERAGPQLAFYMEITGLSMGLVFAVLLTVYAIPQAFNSFTLNETSYSSWKPVIWPFKIFLPVSSFLLALQILADSIFLFLKEGKEEVTS